jgi:selenocysteine-specific elongation factor
MKYVIVGTAGHIDHGKSKLVEALTGTDPDRLAEEKRRGITIDLGFAFLDLEEVRLGFVDVPGHERFVRNMLAGVGGIDLVLLVVAADESVKPQTREHFDICRLLNIPHGLVVITKADLVDRDGLDLVRLEVEDFVRGSFLEGAPILATSAKTGAGLDRLKQALLQLARQVPAKDPTQHFRLPIDRAFAMKGFGTVVTGTLLSGSVRAEEEAELFPSQRRVRIRGVQSAGRKVERAIAGQRTALNLAGVELNEVQRGMVLAAPGRFRPTDRLDARLLLLESARPLKNHAQVHFHQGTAETVAEVILLEEPQLTPGASALAQLRLQASVLVLPGDRFILRQFSPVVTIGGGVVLDALAPRHQQRELPQVLEFLRTLERGDREQILAALLRQHPEGLSVPELVARTGWLEDEVRQVASALERAAGLRMFAGVAGEDGVILPADAFAALLQRLRATVEQFHRQNPLLPGISREDLRSRAAASLRTEVFRAALEELCRRGELTVAGDLVARAGHEVTLSTEEAHAKEQIERAFARAGLTVPAVREVLGRLPVEPKRAQKILQILLREQVLVKVSEELIFHREAIARLRALLADYRAKNGEQLPVPAFKELTGVSRKYAIPLLEYLDRTGVTRRTPTHRVIL